MKTILARETRVKRDNLTNKTGKLENYRFQFVGSRDDSSHTYWHGFSDSIFLAVTRSLRLSRGIGPTGIIVATSTLVSAMKKLQHENAISEINPMGLIRRKLLFMYYKNESVFKMIQVTVFSLKCVL